MNLLKYLANDQQMSVVLVGTSDARVAMQTDAQMSSRFAPFEIPRWRENDDFRRLLATFERCRPCRAQQWPKRYRRQRCQGLKAPAQLV